MLRYGEFRNDRGTECSLASVTTPAVGEDDVPQIPRNLRRRIADAIESRLTLHPHHYGVPLRKTLKSYWKLRVGDYRVVYKIEGNDVWTLAIRHRKTVYEDILRRID